MGRMTMQMSRVAQHKLSSNGTTTVGDGHGTGVDSDVGDARCNVTDMDGLGNLSDMSRGDRDVPRICNSTNTTENAI